MNHLSSSLRGKSILVVGLGLSGRSAVKFLLSLGAFVVGVDKNGEFLRADPFFKNLLERGFKILLENDVNDVSRFDLVVLSPGISNGHPLVQKAKALSIEVIGEVELACRHLTQECVGITGTNGKTTVTLLVDHVLNRCGKPARALGNVEIPLAEALTEEGLKDKILILELSSYQLETLQANVLTAGVILNITPDHLDRYESLHEYAKAKMCLKNCLKSSGALYLEKKAFDTYGELLEGKEVHLIGYSPDCEIFIGADHVSYRGKFQYRFAQKYWGRKSHEVENQAAAFALCRELGVTPEDFMRAVDSFKKPSHRIEFVREISGISFYDDSKGTNIDAVMRAVQSFEESIILIAGGVDKGAPYKPWIDAFEGKVRGVCAIGQSAEKIASDLSPDIPVKTCQNLSEAVSHAARWAQEGEVVLLSPGCSSFDMFRDYKHRGEEFQYLVQQL